MKTRNIYYLSGLLLITIANATIISVPSNQPTIQAGIDAASDGDTVLVQPGTYLENINFNRKNIIVGSLILTTGDTAHISQTIIDGGGAGTVVTFNHNEDTTAILNGFTIINGSSTHGGGIYLSKTNPTCINLKISGNSADRGGGLSLFHSNSHLENIMIVNNNASSGGGVQLSDSNPILKNIMITGNTASMGGGINCSSSSLDLSGITISGNTATNSGGGIYIIRNVDLNFDSDHRCNIFLNQASSGKDLFIYDTSHVEVVLDTFTVQYPTDYYAFPLNNFTFNILNSKINQIDADLYISPNGDDNNSGLSADQPLKTISHAFSLIATDSLHLNTVHLANGVYSPSTTGENFPIEMISNVTLSGESQNGVILNAEGNSQVVHLYYNYKTTIENMTITGGYAEFGGGGIGCANSSLDLKNVTISENYAINGDGGGIQCWSYSDINSENVTITGNRAYYGGGISVTMNSTLKFKNASIKENTAYEFGGGVYVYSSKLFFDQEYRSNIYNNYAGVGNELYTFDSLMVAVIVDTFSVMNPTEYHAQPINRFSFEILHAKNNQVNADLYISPEGNNNNSGISPSEPLKSIIKALTKILADSLNPHTIHLAPGIYSTSNTGEHFPFNMQSYVTISGISNSNTIIDAEGQSGVMYFYEDYRTKLNNLIITGGYSWHASAIFLELSELSISNATITHNKCYSWGSTIECSLARLNLTNTIIWNNSADEEVIVSNYPYTYCLTITHSNIQRGKNAIVLGDQGLMNWLEGNINADPLFVAPENGDFSLQKGSPCIDTGTPFFIWAGDTLINLDSTEYFGSAPDMGAVESPYTASKIDEETLPIKFTLNQNFPNPFNANTMIRFGLPEDQQVSLMVYNICGHAVSVPINNKFYKAGYYDILFDASQLASGIYIYYIKTDNWNATQKMLLIK